MKMSFQFQYISETASLALWGYFHMVLSFIFLCTFPHNSHTASDGLEQFDKPAEVWNMAFPDCRSSQGVMFQPVKANINTEESEQVSAGLRQPFVYLYSMYICCICRSIISYKYTLMLLWIQQLQKKPDQLIFLIDLKVNLMEKGERNPEWMIWKWSWTLSVELFWCFVVHFFVWLSWHVWTGRKELPIKLYWYNPLSEGS